MAGQDLYFVDKIVVSVGAGVSYMCLSAADLLEDIIGLMGIAWIVGNEVIDWSLVELAGPIYLVDISQFFYQLLDPFLVKFDLVVKEGHFLIEFIDQLLVFFLLSSQVISEFLV